MEVHDFLENHFQLGLEFMDHGGKDLGEDLADAFIDHLETALVQQAQLLTNEKMVIPRKPELNSLVRKQVAYAWSIGYAVGKSGFVPQTTGSKQ